MDCVELWVAPSWFDFFSCSPQNPLILFVFLQSCFCTFLCRWAPTYRLVCTYSYTFTASQTSHSWVQHSTSWFSSPPLFLILFWSFCLISSKYRGTSEVWFLPILSLCFDTVRSLLFDSIFLPLILVLVSSSPLVLPRFQTLSSWPHSRTRSSPCLAWCVLLLYIHYSA